MSITHHLDAATLMSFVAGGLPAALSAVAAAHVSMCERCRGEVADLERVGAALIADLVPAGFDRLPPAAPAREPRPAARRAASGHGEEVPASLARLIAGRLDAVAWRWLGPGVWDHPLEVTGRGKLRLLKVAPGRGIPEHGHGGTELTLVLRGAFRDEMGRYAPGDISELDDTQTHHPVIVSDGDCICLVGSEAPERFRGFIPRQWQRLRRL
jgi:putative transcriptional regulator